MVTLKNYLARSHVLLTEDSIKFIEDFMEGHGYKLAIRDGKLFRIDIDDTHEYEEYSYREILDFMADELPTLELPEDEKELLFKKFDELPNWLVH
jgi:hypothetical protein